MEDRDLLGELAPEVARLLERHRRMARPWYPHELVPWERAATTPPGSRSARLPAGVRSALTVNVLTEDNLPFYVTGLHDRFGDASPWSEWLRQWAAEEARHAMVLRDYLLVSGLVDPGALERDRMAHVLGAGVPRSPSVPAALVYLAAQELATRVAHHHTGEALDAALHDGCGRRIMSRVAADENLHFLLYRDLVGALVDLDPSAAVRAVDEQLRHFVMPGRGVPRFAAHAEAIAAAGIFTASTLLDEVLRPLAVQHWAVFELDGLSGEAERSRDRLAAFLDRLARVSGRLSPASAPGAAAPGARS
jgi:acyl-[acyl-carrier-protein] desaturase